MPVVLFYSLLVTATAAIAVPAPAQPKNEAVQTPSVETEIDAVLEVYGGRDALEKASFFRTTGTMFANQHVGGHPGRFVREMRGPQILKIANLFATGKDEVRILKGDRGWRGDKEVFGPSLLSMKLQAARMAMPLSLWTHRKDIVDLGMHGEPGQWLRVLHLQLEKSMFIRAMINPKTRHIERVVGVIQMGPQNVVFVTNYSDFKKREGVLVPFHEERIIRGVNTASVTLETFELLSPTEEIEL